MTIFLSVLAALIMFFYFPLVLRLLWALRYVFLVLFLGVMGIVIWTLYESWQANEHDRQQMIQYQQTHSVR